jgi:hypothetical protein
MATTTVLTDRARIEKFDEAIERSVRRFRKKAQSSLREGTLDPAHAERLRETARRLAVRLSANLPPELHSDAIAEIRGIVVTTLAELDNSDKRQPLDLVEAFVIHAEEIRHIIRDALDEDIGDDGDAASLVATVTGWVPRVSQKDLAALVGVTTRHFQRWARFGGDPPRRLLLVTRLIALLRRAWTPEGVVAWFYRARHDLDGRTPIDVIDDPAYEHRLMTAARQGRAQHGA